MNFSNDGNGLQIRQGIAHLIDKTKFAADEPRIAGYAVPIDNPMPDDNGGLPTPNPCNWDSSFTQSGCTVGASGGSAYHLASATGVNYPWQPALKSPDFCAAAQHFINAQLAGSKNGNCVLTGTSTSVNANPVKFFIRSDDLALLDLGNSLVQEICALFGNGFVDSCPQLSITYGPLDALAPNVQSTAISGINTVWGMFTSGPSSGFGDLDAFQEVADHLTSLGCLPSPPSCKDPFDSSLYFIFNSKFASAIGHQRPYGPCSPSLTASYKAPDYMYLCSEDYDNITSLMEYARCVTASGDPSSGQVVPSYANCSGQPVTGICTLSSACTGVSAGYRAEDLFGRNAYTIPIFDSKGQQYVYLHYAPGNSAATWQRVIDHPVTGPSNYFTWLNAFNPAPTQTGTIRQMMASSTSSINPYTASTPNDMIVLSSIYDSLGATDPLADTQFSPWASTGILQVPNSGLNYVPPSGTVMTYRFTLWPALTEQNGTRVTSFDVAFSYLSLIANGAFQSRGAASMSGITILNPNTFDINVNADNGLFTKIAVTSLTILPGRYWIDVGLAAWDNHVSICSAQGASCYPVQYTLGPPTGSSSLAVNCALAGCSQFGKENMVANAKWVTPFFDPISSHKLVGSGPWTCGTGSGLGQACAPANVQNPGVAQSYSFLRNGRGIAPSFPGDYFRSSGNLALWLWAGGPNLSSNWFSIVASCFNAAPVPLGPVPGVSSCAHWQQGIGVNGATTQAGTGGCPSGPSPCGIPVGTNQLSIVKWMSVPIDWLGSSTGSASTWNTTPPQGIIALDPLLYAGNAPATLTTGYPSFIAGHAQVLSPASLVGCASPYPTGGYDC